MNPSWQRTPRRRASAAFGGPSACALGAVAALNGQAREPPTERRRARPSAARALLFAPAPGGQLGLLPRRVVARSRSPWAASARSSARSSLPDMCGVSAKLPGLTQVVRDLEPRGEGVSPRGSDSLIRGESSQSQSHDRVIAQALRGGDYFNRSVGTGAALTCRALVRTVLRSHATTCGSARAFGDESGSATRRLRAALGRRLQRRAGR
jgi:hypothetical protein